MIDVKNKYHLALNDIGLILQGTPAEPAYRMEQASFLTNRFAQGDRTYDDFSKWWYWAQTDWFQGFKNDPTWADDGKYFLSNNIDTWSETGTMKLAPKQTLYITSPNDRTVTCGSNGMIHQSGGTDSNWSVYGTDKGNVSTVAVFRVDGVGAYTDLASGTITSNQNIVSQVLFRNAYMWVATVGAGTTWKIASYNGATSTWTDQSAYIDTVAMNGGTQGASCRCMCIIDASLYVATDSGLNNKYGIVKTSVATAPTSGSDWASVTKRDVYGFVVDMQGWAGNLLYILQTSGFAELRRVDLATGTDSLIKTFANVNYSTWQIGGKMLVPLGDKMILTVPTSPVGEIWTIDASLNLVRILKVDYFKAQELFDGAPQPLSEGAVITDNKAWWGNLMYDGERFYNTILNAADQLPITNIFYPKFVDQNGQIYGTEVGGNDHILYLWNPNGVGNYKGTSAKNYLIMSNFEKVSGIDKIAFSLLLNFKKFASGQAIKIYYTTGQLKYPVTWTSLGEASYSVDGSTATDKTLFFPNNTLFKKLWVKIELEGDGTTTPSLQDVVLAYLPVPFQDKSWRFNIDCGDDIKLLNNSLHTLQGRQIKGKLEGAWLTNQLVDFQDVDYAQTTLTVQLNAGATTATVADTSEFPEVGRLKIESEVIYYTGKTPTTFTGLVRGRKATKDVQHANSTAVNNGYKALITNINATVPVLNREKRLEYIVGLSVREII